MKKMYTRILATGLVMLAVTAITFMLPVSLLAAEAPAKEGTSVYTKAEMKRMSTFLSNFTELQLLNFTADEVLDPKNPENAIYFGVWHNYINNSQSRTRKCPTHSTSQSWCMMMDGKYVTESLKKYFGAAIGLVAARQHLPHFRLNYDAKGNQYHFTGADEGYVPHAKVESAEKNADGNTVMRGVLYAVDDEQDIWGTFEAVARPHTFNGKATWAIVRMTFVSAR